MEKKFEKTGTNGIFKVHVSVRNQVVKKTVNNPVWHDTEEKMFEVWSIVGIANGVQLYKADNENEGNVRGHIELAEHAVEKQLDLLANGKKQRMFSEGLKELGYS